MEKSSEWTSLEIDGDSTRPSSLKSVYGSNSPRIDHISKSICPNKSIDIQKLVDPKNNYVNKLRVKKGAAIFHSGDPYRYLYSIRDGCVKLEHSLPNGRYCVAQFGVPGDLMGLDGIADGKHHLDAYALNDGELCSFNVNKLDAAVHKDHALLKIIEQLMSCSFNQSQEHIYSLGTHSAEEKLAYFLVDFLNSHSRLHLHFNKIRLPMNREDLGSYLGITLETLSRSFSYLECKGYILVRNRDITFLEIEKLIQILEQGDGRF